MDRLSALAGPPFDVAIVGGGIIGSGIARDAALRGLRVALLERADYGGGTTAGSTRLIHGGLRYLEMLDFALVRMDLTERETLLRIAPHLVKPLEFLLPFYNRGWLERSRLKAGLMLYDLLSGRHRKMPGHRMYSAAQTLRIEPALCRTGLQGAAGYWDAQVDSPERLAIENVLDARAHGAVTMNYAEVVRAASPTGPLDGLVVRDALHGAERELRARVIVNAAGPWFEGVARRLVPAAARGRIRTTKGIHLAADPLARRAVVLFSHTDGRLFFVIPWLGYSWIGTTDTDYAGDPADARATPDDARYLLHAASAFFPALAPDALHWSNAGVRSLVMRPGSESSVSRLHRIETDETRGLVSVLGGKITGYRAIAEQATAAVCRLLRHSAPCTTAERPLPGAAAGNNPPLASATFDAQVVRAVRHEQCVRLSDFFLRRTTLGFARDQGESHISEAVSVIQRELGWSAARADSEAAAYRRWIAGTRAFRIR
jgi:glycerol-3-phosphate dehydrogenase